MWRLQAESSETAMYIYDIAHPGAVCSPAREAADRGPLRTKRSGATEQRSPHSRTHPGMPGASDSVAVAEVSYVNSEAEHTVVAASPLPLSVHAAAVGERPRIEL
jgi:hypothetical protein